MAYLHKNKNQLWLELIKEIMVEKATTPGEHRDPHVMETGEDKCVKCSHFMSLGKQTKASLMMKQRREKLFCNERTRTWLQVKLQTKNFENSHSRDRWNFYSFPLQESIFYLSSWKRQHYSLTQIHSFTKYLLNTSILGILQGAHSSSEQNRQLCLRKFPLRE